MGWLILRAILGAISSTAGAALATVPRDWIERWFAFNPDASSGSLESALPWLLLATGLCSIASVVPGVHRRLSERTTVGGPGTAVRTGSK